jgi:hypothetical protein
MSSSSAHRRNLLEAIDQIFRRRHPEWTDDPRRLLQQIYLWLRWWSRADSNKSDADRQIRDWIEDAGLRQNEKGRLWLRQVSRNLSSPDVVQLAHSLVSRVFLSRTTGESLPWEKA